MNNKTHTSLSLRKLILSALVAAPLATLPTQLWALPSTAASNLTSSAGTNTTFATSGSTLTITTPDRTVLTWGAFGSGSSTIGATDTVSYVLPSASSAVLNRVTGGVATTIDGSLTSNGQIFVLNPSGVIVSSTGKITASGVALSTVPETDYNFLATGSLSYSGTPNNGVSVAGAIKVGQTGAVALAGQNITVGGTIDAGTLTVTAQNSGTVGLSGGLIVGSSAGGYGNVTIASNGGAVDLGATAGSVVISGGNLTVNTVGNATTGGNIGQTTGTVNIGTGTGAGSLVLNTKGTTASGSVTLGAVQGSGGTQLNVGLTTGTTSITDSQGDIQLNTGSSGALSVTASTGNIKSGGNVTASTVSLLSATTAGKNIQYVAVGNTTFNAISSNTTGDVTITGSGTISVPAITSATATLGGTSLTQTGALTVGVATIQPSGNATLTTAGNNFGTVIVKNISGNASIVDTDSITIGNGTNVTGNLTVTSGGVISLGNAATDTITVGGNLALVASTGATSPSIVDATDNTTITGGLTLTAGANDIRLDGSTGTGAGLKSQYGVVSVVSAANATIAENTTLNLGNISVAGNLTAYSNTSIINSGQLKVPGTMYVGAGSASAPGTVSLDYTNSTVGNGNQIAGLQVLTDTGLLGSATVGNYLASSVSVTNENAFTNFAIPANVYGAGLQGNVTLTAAATAGISTANQLLLTGTLTLNDTATGAGPIAVTNVANGFGTLTVKGNNAVSVTGANAYTVNATLNGGANAATFTSGDALTIGSITSNNTGAVTFSAAATKAVTDSVGSIHIYGPVTFTGGSVAVTQSGNNFGGISIDTSGNNGTAAIVESGILNLLSVKTGSGAFTATSQNANITQNGSLTGIISTGSVSLNAPTGAVVATDSTHNNMTGAIAVSAKSDSTVNNTVNTILDNSTVSSGGLNVTISSGANLTQKASTKIYTYGNTTFATAGAGTITVANSGNQFGGVTLTSGTGNVAIKEMTTLNLKSVSTTGTLTATSEGGNIIDSGSGSIGSAGTPLGAATFTASNGSVTLGLANSNYTTVGFTAAGNVSVVDGAADLALAASTVGGTFTATNSTGNISQTGTLVITGNTTFNASAAASSLMLLTNANQFGALSFTVGTGGAIIDELTTLNLRAGSIATGPVTLNTGGNFITSGAGASSFLYQGGTSLTINATGTIIPGSGSLLVLKGLTVNSNNTKDLSGLSLSGNLANVAPTNQGTGSYVAPSP